MQSGAELAIGAFGYDKPAAPEYQPVEAYPTRQHRGGNASRTRRALRRADLRAIDAIDECHDEDC